MKGSLLIIELLVKELYKWPDGSIYEGEVKDGLRHGYGVYKIDEATYEGEWK
jgi:hypothetical protein